jgi:hypothetical protein
MIYEMTLAIIVKAKHSRSKGNIDEPSQSVQDAVRRETL